MNITCEIMEFIKKLNYNRIDNNREQQTFHFIEYDV